MEGTESRLAILSQKPCPALILHSKSPLRLLRWLSTLPAPSFSCRPLLSSLSTAHNHGHVVIQILLQRAAACYCS